MLKRELEACMQSLDELRTSVAALEVAALIAVHGDDSSSVELDPAIGPGPSQPA